MVRIFSGYIYFKETILGKCFQEHFHNISPGKIIYESNRDKYCIAIAISDKNLSKVPGYDGKRHAAT